MADNLNSAELSSAQDRQKAVEQLYIQNFGFIRELIHSDPHISTDAENQILEGIAKHLHDFDAVLTDSAFQAWITEILVPLVGFYVIKSTCEPFVRAAIWRGLGHSAEPSKYDDYPETVRELEQEVWLWTYLNLDNLKKNRRAKITTRLYKRASIMTQDWMKRQRTRRFAVIRRVYNLPSKAKMDTLAEKLATGLDRERLELEQKQAEREEIQQEMKKMELMA